METKEWRQVKDVFFEVLEKPQAARADFLREVCGADSGLRAEVENLLAAHFESESFIENPAFEVASVFKPNDAANPAEKHFGNYKIIREIGAGGMGAVFLAERSDGEFEQQVAVKIIRQSIADKQITNRFKRERQILASLNHPNIARLLDGGITPDGLPFLAMEYVEGLPVNEFAETRNLSVEERLELFLQVCAGVAFAHRNLIVHRDLKPSNIFVTKDGAPKLLDFGLAKLLDESLDAEQTQTAFRALTPAYASPEQLKGETITTASDVYSLGVVLYELLTGERPFHFKNPSLEEAVHVVCDSDPIRPSEAAKGDSKITNYELREATNGARQTETRDEKPHPKSKIQNLKSLKGDLDTIVLQALRKEPERRYKSVPEFAEDIERYLQGLPVKARPNTFTYRAEKFFSRNIIAVAASLLILLTLIGGITATAWQARASRIERDAAQREKVKAERVSAFLEGMLGSPAVSEKGRDVKVIDVLDESAQRIGTELADQPEVLASVEHTLGFSYGQIGNIDASIAHTKTSMDLTAQVYGEQSVQYAFVANEYANILYSKGDYADSEKFCRQSTEIFRQIGEGESKEVANNLILLGLLLADKGQLDEAEQTYAESLDIFRKVGLIETQAAGSDLNNLGHLNAQKGDYDKAERYYKEAVAISRKQPDAFSQVSLATALQNLGAVYKQKGDYAQAEPLIREAVDLRRKLLGERHPHVAIAQCHLSDLFYRQGEYDKAIAEAQSALELQRAVLPAGHADIARSLVALGQALTAKGEATRAEPFLREAVEIRTKTLTSGSPLLSAAKSALGECLAAQGKFQEAEPLAVGSYEALEASQGAKSFETIEALNRAIELYEKWNKSEEAERFRAQLFDAQKNVR